MGSRPLRMKVLRASMAVSSGSGAAVATTPEGGSPTAAPDPELTAMLARAAVSIGLEVNRPPSPEPSRLDDWFLRAGRGSQPRPAPVPFFPEVHEELTSSWMAPFMARSRSSASSVLTTLDGGVARGYAGIPQVERAVAVHLCPRNAATWRNRPRLPSKACKLTAALAAKAYSAAGQAASALHAMAILQVHQAKALKQVHEGSTDPGLMQELRTATDFALRATKVTARSLGKAMSTMVVQERHLWLNLAEMKDVDKARFLDAPISQGGLFGDTVEGFAQQFSAVQQQTEAIQHILPRRDAPSTAAPGARPQSARRRGRPPASSRAAPPQAESTHRPARRASRRRAAPPASQPGPKSSRKSTKRPWRGQPGDVGVCSFSGDGENSAAPSPGGGPGEESSVSFRFVSVSPLVQGPAVPTFSKKEQFPFSPGSQVHGTTVCDALPPHSRPRPILPVAKRVRFGDDIPPHAPLASPVRDPGSSVRMPQNAPPSVPSTPTPFRCTITGTLIVPLEPLAQRLEAWLTLPSLSRWLTRTIRLGYAIQFARRPPKFNGVLETSVAVRNAPVLREEIAVLLAKDAIEPVPPAEMRQGFYSPYFIVPKKGGGLRPILDLRVLNRALHKLPFKMLTHRRMIKCIQPQDWFAAIDLKDAYFHVSILPRHRPFLRFAFEDRAWQYRVLPFGLSLSPRVFTKVVEGALTPLREVGVRILNYLDDWLILAQSREQLGDHRDLVLRHLSQLGLRVNWEKSKLSPVQRISFLGVELDSVSMTARLTEERAQAVLNWTGPRLLWHINCLELWAVHLALRQFRPLLLGKHVLVRTDNTAAVSYINRLGGIRSHRMSQLARHLLLWSHTQFKSLRAVHIPGQLNRAADALSRQLTFPGECRLHPETIRLIWSRFGEAQVDLFASPSPPTASCTSPWPRAPSAQTHWHTAGLGPYASMRFPQWAYLHRHCASSGRTRSRSCWLRPIGPPGPGFPNSFPSFLQRQKCGTTETVSEAPGAYGIRSCSHAARIASYETTSALATLPGPEVGMAPRDTASRYLPAVSPLPQPLDRPCLSTGRGAPRTSVPAYCCHNRCLQHGLGRYMQWAGSLGALDRAPTALAHQLPGAVGSAFSLAAVPATAVGQARASPHGQHCGGLVYQPAGGYTITPHVTARPPSPPLESHAVQVTACCSHPGAAQSCGRRALTTAHVPRRMPTPSRDDPADLESIRGSSGRPVCLPESSHCQLYFSLTEGPLGTDALAHSWPRALRKYAFPPVSLLAQTLCKLREDEEQVLLVAPHWPTRTWFPELISLATVPPWRIPLRKDLLSQGLGTIWHPRPDLWNLHVWLLDGTRQTWVVYHRRW